MDDSYAVVIYGCPIDLDDIDPDRGYSPRHEAIAAHQRERGKALAKRGIFGLDPHPNSDRRPGYCGIKIADMEIGGSERLADIIKHTNISKSETAKVDEFVRDLFGGKKEPDFWIVWNI